MTSPVASYTPSHIDTLTVTNKAHRLSVDMAEKTGLVNSANQWMEVRELRNKMAHEYTHEYTRDDLKLVFDDVLKYTP